MNRRGFLGRVAATLSCLVIWRKTSAAAPAPFEHCRTCIRMVSDTCKREQRCFHQVYLTGKIEASDGFKWYADPDVNDA